MVNAEECVIEGREANEKVGSGGRSYGVDTRTVITEEGSAGEDMTCPEEKGLKRRGDHHQSRLDNREAKSERYLANDLESPGMSSVSFGCDGSNRRARVPSKGIRRV
jgi:hypothetical protein